MNRQSMRSIARRRLNDNLSGSGQVYSDSVLNDELNEAIYDVCGEVELEGALWRLASRYSFTLDLAQTEYSLASATGFFIPRKLIRTDVTPTIPCEYVDFRDLETYNCTAGLNDDDGYYYSIGPNSSGVMSVVLPVLPALASTMVLHYMRTPTLLTHDTSDVDPNVATPPDIPVMLHRLVPLKAAMNLLGPDQDGGGAYQALAAEYGDVLRRGLRLLRRTYQQEFVEDITGW